MTDHDGPQPTPLQPARMTARRFDRRTLIAGAAGAVGVAGAGAIAFAASRTERDDSPQSAATATAPAAAQAAVTTQAPALVVSSRQQVANVPDGQALITSPRLPLFGIGENDVAGLLNGQTTDWNAVGTPNSLTVIPVALEGNVPEGMTPAETFGSYDALADFLAENPGAVAMAPVSDVDFRANVLSVSGFDPLRDQDGDGAPVRVAFVGDIVPGRNVTAKAQYYGDWVRPFRKIATELQSYDVTIANLEGNVSPNIPAPTDPHTFSFISDPQFLEGLVFAGIDAVSLANNHSAWNDEEWGLSAFNDTMASLESYGIPYFGGGHDLASASAPWVAEIDGVTIAIIGIDGVTANPEQTQGVLAGNVGATNDSGGTNPFVTESFTADIAAMTERYDIVIPYFHMGVEYVPTPPDWALAGARAAIDAGATMVVTNHPHVIQGMETYGGKPIVYSVGNFVFDQMFSNEVRTGTVLEIVLQHGKVVGLRPKGVEIVDFHQPRLMSAGEHASLMDRFWQSADLIARK